MVTDIYKRAPVTGLEEGAEYDPSIILLIDEKSTAKLKAAVTTPLPDIDDLSEAETLYLEAWRKDTDNQYFETPVTSPHTRMLWYRWLNAFITRLRQESEITE